MKDPKTWSRLRVAFWIGSIAFVAVQIWSRRFYVNPDGINYLDVADAYRRGDWSTAINGFWSPLYSWILAGWLGLLKPSPFLEATAVHVLGIVFFVLSLASFEFFLNELLLTRRSGPEDHGYLPALPDDSFRLLAYGIFLWSWFFWLAFLVTPDLLMTVFAYLAAGLLLRIHRGDMRWLTSFLFGSCLALAYLAKTAMFPLAFVFLAVGWLSARRRSMPRRMAVAFLAFVLVALPWILVLRVSKHRWTFGDAGRLNYTLFVGGYPVGESPFPDSTLPRHPTLRVLPRPALLALKSEVPGTYPFAYDLSYWFEGVPIRFSLRKQLLLISISVGSLWSLLVQTSFLAVGAYALGYFSRAPDRGFKLNAAAVWVILIPPCAGILMYSLVWLEPRYIASFVVMIWLGVFAALERPAPSERTPVARALTLAMLLAMVIGLAPEALSNARSLLAITPLRPDVAPRDWRIAQSLERIGLQRGDRIAVIGRAVDAYWARVAGLKIVAVVPAQSNSDFERVADSEFLLLADGAMSPEAVSAFASTGARAIVAQAVPRRVGEHGWVALEDTKLFAYALPGLERRERLSPTASQ